MKKTFKLSAVLLSILAIVIMMFPCAATAAAPPTYPTSIDGMPVILVEDSTNTVSVPKGNVIICLYDQTSNTIEESAAKLNSNNFMVNHPLQKGWSILVYGGSGASSEQFLTTHDNNNKFHKQYGMKTGAVPQNVSVDTTSKTKMIPLTTPPAHSPSFTIDQNRDPDPNHLNQTITYQAGFWQSPFIAINQDKYSAFLNNVETDVNYSDTGRGWLLQSGQTYDRWHGENVYSDSSLGLNTQDFNIPYITGDSMEFDIYLDPGSNLWRQTCWDITQNQYAYNVTWVQGTKAVFQTGTGIWFENWNTVNYWWQWFTNPIISYTALDGGYHNQKWWNSDLLTVIDCWGQFPPVNNIITGSLVGGGQAYWHISQILIGR